jgi:hypothetical protein
MDPASWILLLFPLHLLRLILSMSSPSSGCRTKTAFSESVSRSFRFGHVGSLIGFVVDVGLGLGHHYLYGRSTLESAISLKWRNRPCGRRPMCKIAVVRSGQYPIRLPGTWNPRAFIYLTCDENDNRCRLVVRTKSVLS